MGDQKNITLLNIEKQIELIKEASFFYSRYYGLQQHCDDFISLGFALLVDLGERPELQFTAYIRKALQNRILNYMRDQKILYTVNIDDLEPVPVIWQTVERYGDLWITKTKGVYERTLLSMVMQGFTLNEIAKHLGVSKQAISARLHGMRRRFKVVKESVVKESVVKDSVNQIK